MYLLKQVLIVGLSALTLAILVSATPKKEKRAPPVLSQWEIESRRNKDMEIENPKNRDTQSIWDDNPGHPAELVDSVIPVKNRKGRKFDENDNEIGKKRSKSYGKGGKSNKTRNLLKPQGRSMDFFNSNDGTTIKSISPESSDSSFSSTDESQTGNLEYDLPYYAQKLEKKTRIKIKTTTMATTTTTKVPESHQYFPEDPSITMFTVANTDTGFSWDQIPFQEKYQWMNPDAPCHSFVLKIPDDRDDHTSLTLCIFRHQLEFEDDSEIFINRIEKEPEDKEFHEFKVYGHVVGQPGSEVNGHLVSSYFYGEVYIHNDMSNQSVVYVVEEIRVLDTLLQHNEKIMRNLLLVMNKGAGTPSVRYNAVVTKGISLMSYMLQMMMMTYAEGGLGKTPFLVFSTSHNSYITSGNTTISTDEQDRLIFSSSGNHNVTIETDGSVTLKTRKNREYTFWPNGRTILQQGLDVQTLQEHEGAVAVSAFTKITTYGCILPTPTFSGTRKGGYVCKVCLGADKLFEEFYVKRQGKRLPVPFALGRIVDEASWIFRAIDWNEDGFPDNVGLDYDNQFAMWSYDDNVTWGVDDISELKKSAKEEISEEELNKLFDTLQNIDFSGCCLGIIYTMKNLPKDVFAKTSTAKPKYPAGICSVRTDGIFNNLILISANSKKKQLTPMTHDQLVYLTAHQIAKAFGAPEDGRGAMNCDQFVDDNGDVRHYLMWPDVMRNITVAEKSLSPCSKRAIKLNLMRCKSSCFEISKYPFCGNGITEDGEECDCGSEEKCSKQRCCYARKGAFPCRKTGYPCKHKSSGNMVMTSLTLLIISALSLINMKYLM